MTRYYVVVGAVVTGITFVLRRERSGSSREHRMMMMMVIRRVSGWEKKTRRGSHTPQPAQSAATPWVIGDSRRRVMTDIPREYHCQCISRLVFHHHVLGPTRSTRRRGDGTTGRRSRYSTEGVTCLAGVTVGLTQGTKQDRQWWVHQ